MASFDLRYAIPILINILKFAASAMITDWDMFNTFNSYITWLSVFILVLIFIFFPCITINLSPNNNNMHLVQFQRESLPSHLTVLLMGSIVFPPELFFPYAYFGVLVFAFGYPTVLSLLTRLVAWLHAKLSQQNQRENMEIPALEP